MAASSSCAQPADLRLIVSSIQFLAEGHGWERWGNLPRERRRLIDLIAATRANGVVFLSGDRHLSALYEETTGVPYRLVEITSSSLNQPYRNAREAGPNRIGDALLAGEFRHRRDRLAGAQCRADDPRHRRRAAAPGQRRDRRAAAALTPIITNEDRMIRRLPGSVPGRSRAVIHDGLVFAVATARDEIRTLRDQTRDALAVLDRNLAEAGTQQVEAAVGDRLHHRHDAQAGDERGVAGMGRSGQRADARLHRRGTGRPGPDRDRRGGGALARRSVRAAGGTPPVTSPAAARPLRRRCRPGRAGQARSDWRSNRRGRPRTAAARKPTRMTRPALSIVPVPRKQGPRIPDRRVNARLRRRMQTTLPLRMVGLDRGIRLLPSRGTTRQPPPFALNEVSHVENDLGGGGVRIDLCRPGSRRELRRRNRTAGDALPTDRRAAARARRRRDPPRPPQHPNRAAHPRRTSWRRPAACWRHPKAAGPRSSNRPGRERPRRRPPCRRMRRRARAPAAPI